MTALDPVPSAGVLGNVEDPTARRRPRRRLTSRQRLTLQLLAGLTVLFAVCGGTAVILSSRALADRLDKDLTAVGINTANTLERLPVADYSTLASRTAIDGQTYTVILVAPDGTQTRLSVSVGVDPAQVTTLLPVAELRARSGQPFTTDDPNGTGRQFRVVSVAMSNGYLVIVSRSPDGDNAVLTTIARVFLVAFVILFAALCLLVWLVSRQALKPLEEVIASAEDIDYDNLASRVEIASDAQDVNDLAGAINDMLARIQTTVAGKLDADRRLRQFVADASHELRTPLAAVLGYTELYEAGIATQPDQIDKAMRRIAVEGDRMQRLVDDLLTLARLDERRPARPSSVDLRSIVTEAVAAAQATDRERAFVVAAAGPSPIAIVDPDAIRQILDNLLANVRNHTPPGTTATVTLTATDDTAGVVVSDDGPGMPPAELARAFDRFWRADAARVRPGGSGLGLAIVRGLVEANDCRIRLSTADTGGLAVQIDLPLASPTHRSTIGQRATSTTSPDSDAP